MATASRATTNPNANLSMSAEARLRLRNREQVRGYYNDMGGSRGNCTYGIGILVHRGPCTEEELQCPLTAAQVAVSFATAISSAERAVRRSVSRQVHPRAIRRAGELCVQHRCKRGIPDV